MSDNANEINQFFSDSSDADTIVVNHSDKKKESNVSLDTTETTETEEYKTLKRDYDTLVEEFDKLKLEYSENTIIQSMNDMKERYNELVNTTVSLYRYKALEKKYNTIYRASFSSLAIISHAKKIINKLDTRMIYDPERYLVKCKNDLDTLYEIIEDAINENA